MYKQSFHGAANTVAVRLGVDCDIMSRVRIGGLVDVQMAVTVQMLDQWDARFSRKPFNQAFTAAWHNDVDVVSHGDHFAYRSTIGRIHDLYSVCGQAC